MANLLYLVGALSMSVLLCVVVWLRNRRPRSTEYAIESFRRELEALAPPRPVERERRRTG